MSALEQAVLPTSSARPPRPRIALVIPTLNEEEPIGEVLRAVPRDIVDDIIVADSGSVDRTVKRARAAGDPDSGETYYLHWLSALEKLVAKKGVTTTETLHRYRDAWEHACDRTPHGQPIELREEDFV